MAIGQPIIGADLYAVFIAPGGDDGALTREEGSIGEDFLEDGRHGEQGIGGWGAGGRAYIFVQYMNL